VLSSASDNPAYNFDPADVTGLNFDNEPVSITVGGCGLLGPDLLLPFAILALWRRRRR
jgi:predicted component of type VI protein secretion system